MFTSKKKATYQKLLGLDESGLNEFAKRYSHYLQKQEVMSSRVIINGMFILESIIKAKAEVSAEKTYWKTKNIILLKYAKEIKYLYEEKGLGSSKILLHLKINHAVKKGISKSTLDRFIKNNNLKRVQNSG